MIEVRPQPIGIYPSSAAYLLLPQVDDDRGALEGLLEGNLDVPVPDTWQFFVQAARGNLNAAVALVSDSDSPLAAYNRLVLEPDSSEFESLRARLPLELAALLDLVAYNQGILDRPGQDLPFDGELLAFALASQAAAAMENQDNEIALRCLTEAVDAARGSSPLLASMLLAQKADLAFRAGAGSYALATIHYREAIRLASDCKLPTFIPSLHTRLGMALQSSANGQRGVLLEAVRSYQAALQNGITQQAHPDWFAQLQNNLGLAYLSMPATETSDQLRMGIAIQSFRHSLNIYTIEDHPDMWATVSMNLANALQHVPTSHPETNLIQSVEIYEDVLRVRTREKDPVAYATVLLNQANALAHLGIFKPAIEKLSEAYKLFHWYDQPAEAEAARDLVDQINQRMNEHAEPQKVPAN